MERYVQYLRKSRFDRDYAELNVEAVSYTHLDMYKRQDLSRKIVGIFIHEL